MEPKKSEKADVDRRRGLFFLIGLTFSLVFVVVVLNWEQAQGEIDTPMGNLELEEEEELIDITRQEQKSPPPPPPPQIEEVPDEEEIEEEVVDMDIEATEDTEIETIVEEGPEEVDEDEVFVMVEDNPSFPGGQEAMFAFIGKNVQYPRMEQENNITGRVTVSFIVEKDGSISNVKVLKGVSPGLDKEAIRVIKSMPKWSPGQQQDRKVRVKVTIPIFFRLN